jgi:hypothetical protein
METTRLLGHNYSLTLRVNLRKKALPNSTSVILDSKYRLMIQKFFIANRLKYESVKYEYKIMIKK